MVKKEAQKSKNKAKVARFEPTKMSLAVSAAAATILVLCAVIAVYL